MPADLWRGRFTVSSVIETVLHVVDDGLLAAQEWVLYGGDGDELVSERTLRRWRDLTRSRLIGSALAWLGPSLGLTWSGRLQEADQLSTLLEHLTPEILLSFRARFGRAVVDKSPARPPAPQTLTRRVPGRLAVAPPHNPPSKLLPRGQWSYRTGRGPPVRYQPKEENQ
jgi:hypothetical protein